MYEDHHNYECIVAILQVDLNLFYQLHMLTHGMKCCQCMNIMYYIHDIFEELFGNNRAV